MYLGNLQTIVETPNLGVSIYIINNYKCRDAQIGRLYDYDDL